MDLESLRQILTSKQMHIGIGKVLSLALAKDRSVLRVTFSLFPEEREYVGKMSWQAVGEESGFFVFPSVNDMILVAFPDTDNEDSHADDVFVLSRLTTKDDKIPIRAAEGDCVLKAKSGKNVWLTSDELINFSRGDAVPTENLVLGQVLKDFLSDLLEKIANHTHVGNNGFPTSPPQDSADYLALKASPVDNEQILSDLSFTEK